MYMVSWTTPGPEPFGPNIVSDLCCTATAQPRVAAAGAVFSHLLKVHNRDTLLSEQWASSQR